MQLKKIFDSNRPVILCIMDGIGYGQFNESDAFYLANTPNLDRLHSFSPHIPLIAHGKAVGLPSDGDMGNSEVGHNAIGGGKVVNQGAELVNNAIESKSLFKGQNWKKLISNVLTHHSTLHFIGLFSDGNVHSHINHLKAMIEYASKEGISKIRLHPLLDGRDVGETTALKYIEPFENYIAKMRKIGLDIEFASGGGRMIITMDRYGSDWSMVERGYNAHVHGKGRGFSSVKEAIETYRQELVCSDQNLPEFVILDKGKPVGKIRDNDSVIFFNFRGDRAVEISQAFELSCFSHFDRGQRPKVEYAGIMEYDGDENIPIQYLVSPPIIDNPLGEYLVNNQLRQFAISETQKFGHVTFFFNGNRSGKFDDNLETFCEISSDKISFEQRPWMKAVEITDEVIKQLYSKKFDFLRLNYANGDMVGHTGDIEATRIACEVVDYQVGRLMKAVKKENAILVVTADHGNADDMHERKNGKLVKNNDGSIKPKTSHSLNKVPFIIYDPQKLPYQFDKDFLGGLGNIASTCLNLLGYKAPEDFNRSLLLFKK